LTASEQRGGFRLFQKEVQFKLFDVPTHKEGFITNTLIKQDGTTILYISLQDGTTCERTEPFEKDAPPK
jgi:hypothetical protein